jgi:chromosomal replication initiation ATPase DnaA
MGFKNYKMNQLVFKFPFKVKYYEQDFYVSSNNFSAYKLIENWPNWPGRWLNIFGSRGSGKTHLSKILEKKINRIKLIDAVDVNNNLLDELNNFDCLIIDSFSKNINEKLLYSILNQSKQLENYIMVNSITPLKTSDFELKDLQSRLNSFIDIGIELPTDELLQVIISKSFSDRQINLNPKISEYIIKNVERSYEKMFKFLKDIDELSLSTGKSININLIKKVLNQ